MKTLKEGHFFLNHGCFPYFFAKEILDTYLSSPFCSYEAEKSAIVVNLYNPLPLPTPGADSSL
jgi:hypothetical protein